MRTARIQMRGRLHRSVPGLLVLALVTTGALAGAGPAAAARHGAALVRDVRVPWNAAGRSVAAGTISTVAGGLGGPAKGTKVALGVPCGVGYGAGSVYVASGTVVRKLDPATGEVATAAGTGLGRGGVGGNGIPAADATFGEVCSAVVDPHGNLVVVDTSGGTVEVVAAATGTFYGQAMTAGGIYTVAGDGAGGFSGDGGPATAAGLAPQGVTVDGAGNLVVADIGNDRVRVVAVTTGTFYRKKMTAGDIYTVAGGGIGGLGDGGPATAAQLEAPDGAVTDGAGNLVIADTSDQRIRVVAVKTGTSYGRAMTAGDIYTVAGNGMLGFSGDGAPATAAELFYPEGVTADGSRNLLIADGSGRIRKVTG